MMVEVNLTNLILINAVIILAILFMAWFLMIRKVNRYVNDRIRKDEIMINVHAEALENRPNDE
jgi:pentose-5-phosphate-3-epimerase